MSARYKIKQAVLLTGSALLLAPVTAFAQSAGETVGESDDPNAIIVTAQKRAENIQDVPLAVTVVTGEQLQSADVQEFSELYKIAPSLAIRPSDSAQNASITIRGYGTLAFSIGVESAVAIQIDDVPVAFQARAFSDLADIERVEVLRGPQSTLYGKNASAGLINIVTRSPSDVVDARGSVTATSDDEYHAQVSLSGPMSDTLGLLVSGSYRTFDGNVKNLTTGETVNGSDNITLRTRAVWEPTSNLSADFNVSFAQVDSDPTTVFRVLSPAARLRGVASQTPQVFAPGVTASADNLEATYDDQPFFRSTGYTPSARITWDLPSDHSLVSITAYDHYQSEDRIDSDRGVSSALRNSALGNFDADSFTQELRLLSPGSGPLRYTLGLFYADQTQRRDYVRGSSFSLADWEATAGSTQMAVFGQADWEFAPRTTLTAGLRGQREKIDYSFTERRTAPATTYVGDSSDEVITWRAGLKHELNDDLMVFGSYSRGHKGQAYDLTTGFNQARADRGPIQPEKSDAFELGARAQLFDRRLTLNGTVFQTTYRNLQVQVVEDIDGVPTFRLANVGESRTRGLEVDFLAEPVDGLNLFGGLTYLDAVQLVNPAATCYPGQTAEQGCTGTPPSQDLSGERLGVPRWRGNVGFDFEVMSTNGVEGLIGGAFTWQDKTPNNDPVGAIDAFGLLNLNVGIQDVDQRWALRLFVNNVFDKGYFFASSNLYNTFGAQSAQDFLPPRDFERHVGLRLSTRM